MSYKSKINLGRASLFFCIVLQYNMLFSQNRVALTFDDLPCLRCEDNELAAEITSKLLKTLKDYKAPAIGFVNEIKLYSDGKPDKQRIHLLEEWLQAGHSLGNHTFSHVWINSTDIDKYEAEIVKGEQIIRPLTEKYNRPLNYFRHTQLRTGPTSDYKAALDSIIAHYNYTTAAVTMDNDEYIYAHCYDIAREHNDDVSMRLIAYAFLQHMREIIVHYESESQEFLGYNLPHILLLHSSALVADYLPVLMGELRSRDYNFITLEEALRDSAYQLPEAVCTRGLSWLKRWQLAAGKKIESQPAVQADIQDLYAEIRNGEYSPYITPKWIGNAEDIESIRMQISDFSKAYVQGNFDDLAESYTENGKIFPHKAPIIAGQKAIRERWILPNGVKILHHIITPLEIEVVGTTAYDHGYYEGSTKYRDNTVSKWVGKYVIVWKKVGGEWKIYLDIWNKL